ncbi:MAG TPA: exodeoxyribonuclease VII small subunit [Candidatus Dormibacteraeota bacterium]|nr:exodeoxyribonuclease VII small subunit [Candidatus Dormibacteraeota bacterium]
MSELSHAEGSKELGERSLDDLLAELEKSISRLADGSAPLEELVSAHQRAVTLLAEAQGKLAELRDRAGETAQLLTQ